MGRLMLYIIAGFFALKCLQVVVERDPYESVVARVAIQLSAAKNVPVSEDQARERIVREAGLVGRLGIGLLRRLDDASFWTALACLLAGAAVCGVAVPPGVLVVSKHWRVFVWSLFACWLVTYFIRMCFTGGTCCWWWANWEPLSWRFWVIAIVQMCEFILNGASIMLLCVAVIHGYGIVKAIAATAPFDAPGGSALLTACVSPFVLMFFVVAVFKLVASDIGFVDEGSLLFGTKLVGQLVAAWTPALALGVLAVVCWGPQRRYQLRLGKEVLSVEVR